MKFENNIKNNKWKKFYIDLAKKYATMSKDPKFKVGCVIVTKEGIIYPGYNGDEIGGTNKRESLETGCSGFIHAEANAITKFNPIIHKDASIFLTYSPCIVCARMIINTQSISKVYYSEIYGDDDSIKLLESRGIRCEKVF